jgi:ATP-dependent helicase IRC3
MDQGGVAEATERLTKGEAANIITRLKHGAHVCCSYFLSILSRLSCSGQSYYEKKAKQERKGLQVAEKERLRIAREAIIVGPLDQP